MRLSQRYPVLFFLAVWRQRFLRFRTHYKSGHIWATQKNILPLPNSIKTHQSQLLRKLGDTDPQLQINKVHNLKIAVKLLNGVLIRPGETFSFYRWIGWPHRLRGFKMGLELASGQTTAGYGGGLCQIANMLHWLVLHSSLTVTEHHHHSFDLFPDQDRVVPFGCGATIFYNYLDYKIKNETDQTFQIMLQVTENTLDGALRVDQDPGYSFTVYDKNHAFIRENNVFYRINEIWRDKVFLEAPEKTEAQLIQKNKSQMLYIPDDYEEIKLE